MTPPGFRGRLRTPWRRAAAVLGGQRRRAAQAAVLSLLSGAAESAALVVMALVAVGMADGTTTIDLGPTEPGAGAALAGAATLLVVRLGLGVASARLTAGLGASAQAEARRELVGAYCAAEWSIQAEEERGRLQDLVGVTAAGVGTLTVAAATVLTASMTFLVMVVTAVVISPGAALVIVGVAAVVVAVLRPAVRRMRRLGGRSVEAERRLAGTVAEAVTATREARAFGVLDRLEAAVDADVAATTVAYRNTRFSGLVAPTAVHSLVLLGMVGVLAGLVATGSRSQVGALGASALILIRSSSYGQQLNAAVHRLAELAPNRAVLDAQLAEYRRSAAPPGDVLLPDVTRVVVDAVRFAYVPDRPVLRDVTFAFGRGEVVGIVGPSGGGKSTLLQLLLRLRRPTAGRILCDGVDLTSVSAVRWARLVGFVPQDPTIFRGSVTHNIAFWRDLPDDAVVAAARRAHVDDDIRDLADGYATVLGGADGGLSGGQLQRLAIARALAGGPRLLLLDEPTSALDAESEAKVRNTLDALRGDLATVVVAHRESTITACDRVLILDGGRCTEVAPTDVRAWDLEGPDPGRGA